MLSKKNQFDTCLANANLKNVSSSSFLCDHRLRDYLQSFKDKAIKEKRKKKAEILFLLS